ncbi:PadR family transcriptional regulator [Vagococcus sp. BWB3-3]|uniref:PadR family transcriptional regulator n=1 Tax=Vagococcus allomyrinae TaxID=2794353 RepID=A0A940P897_9ENTE|nr:PadR family transcriptional regulator [Vagococcus allomyrinae]MBP1039910.1 PadR family transcriptional regulator [Vagococcus allomyrinae]
MKNTNQFKKGVLELCVLYSLQKKDRYGYELTQKIDHHISITEGALYPVLRRLVKEGYCKTYLKESSSGPARKYYSLTNEGRDYLGRLTQEWDIFVQNVQFLREEEDNEQD